MVSSVGPDRSYPVNMRQAYTELTSLRAGTVGDVTAGTVVASKTVTVDANKDVGDFRNLDATNLDAGLSGTAGTVDVFPATAAKGKLAITAADSSGDTTTTIVNASQAAARTYTIPDAGAAASFVMTEGAQTVNGDQTFGGSIIRTGKQYLIGTSAKVGGTAGWVVGAADNLGLMATIPASQSGSTLVVPVDGLRIGDTITAFSIVGQIESDGGAVTLDADLRKMTAAAADVTDASLDSITQISVTADAIVSASKTLGTPEVVAADETFYILLTATTGASTDIALQGATITVTTS